MFFWNEEGRDALSSWVVRKQEGCAVIYIKACASKYFVLQDGSP